MICLSASRLLFTISFLLLFMIFFQIAIYDFLPAVIYYFFI